MTVRLTALFGALESVGLNAIAIVEPDLQRARQDSNLRASVSYRKGHSGSLGYNRKLALVDLPTVPKGNYDYQEYVVFNRVDDAVAADPDPQPGPPPQRASRRWSRVFSQERDRALDAPANLRVELSQRANGRRPKFYAVLAQSQPRSALTSSQGMFGPSSSMAESKAATSSASSSASIISS